MCDLINIRLCYLRVRKRPECSPGLSRIGELDDGSETIRRKQQTTDRAVSLKQLPEFIGRRFGWQVLYQERRLATLSERLQSRSTSRVTSK